MLVPVLSRRVTQGHWRVAVCAAAGTLLLGGCALLQPPPKPSHPAAHLPPKPHPVPPTTPTGSAAAAGALHPPPSAPGAAAPPSAAPPPVRVVGWSQEAVRRLLGPPAEQSAQGAAQTWRYRGADCQVDIAFYYDVTRGDFFALSQHREAGGDAAACLARLRAGHGD